MSERLAIGGLMRCCTDTWAGVVETIPDPQDGEVIRCRYQPDDPTHRMVRDGGIWKWAGPSEDMRAE